MMKEFATQIQELVGDTTTGGVCIIFDANGDATLIAKGGINCAQLMQAVADIVAHTGPAEMMEEHQHDRGKIH